MYFLSSKQVFLFYLFLTISGAGIFPHIVLARTFRTSFISWESRVGTGIGAGQLSWNIAEISGTPNVLSELNYHLHNIWLATGQTRLTLKKGIIRGLFIDISGQWGIIRKGTATDRDWAQNNRQKLFSLSHSDTTGNTLKQINIGIGFSMHPFSHITFSPLVGYSYKEQNIRVQNGVQDMALSTYTYATPGRISKLDSSYNSRWEGSFIGAELKYQFYSHQNWIINAQYHRVHYNAYANWNLRKDLDHPVSFQHSAEQGKGIAFITGWQSLFTKHFSLSLLIHYQKFYSGRGIDRLFFSNNTYAVSPLNNVQWEITELTLTADYRF